MALKTRKLIVQRFWDLEDEVNIVASVNLTSFLAHLPMVFRC